MSTVSGEESVRINLAPRRTRPGLRGRRLVVTCINEHIVPQREQIDIPWRDWRCSECGIRQRKFTWLCATLHQEAWEWVVWGSRALVKSIFCGGVNG